MTDLVPLTFPHLGDLLQDVDEARPPPFRGWREIRTSVEGLQLGREPDAHRPAARPGRRLHERHVHAIDVRPLLAIHLHRYEMLVQHAGDRIALERLALHDVAPVARGIPDRKKDRLVLRARLRERIVTPWIPLDGVACVLKKIGAALAREAIHRSTMTLPFSDGRWQISISTWALRYNSAMSGFALAGKRVAMLVEDGFEDRELVG